MARMLPFWGFTIYHVRNSLVPISLVWTYDTDQTCLQIILGNFLKFWTKWWYHKSKVSALIEKRRTFLYHIDSKLPIVNDHINRPRLKVQLWVMWDSSTKDQVFGTEGFKTQKKHLISSIHQSLSLTSYFWRISMLSTCNYICIT